MQCRAAFDVRDCVDVGGLLSYGADYHPLLSVSRIASANRSPILFCRFGRQRNQVNQNRPLQSSRPRMSGIKDDIEAAWLFIVPGACAISIRRAIFAVHE
jgi:hypothetical protein